MAGHPEMTMELVVVADIMAVEVETKAVAVAALLIPEELPQDQPQRGKDQETGRLKLLIDKL